MALPKITSAFLNLTNACCLACKYCFVHQSPEHMTLQVAKDAADFLAANAKAQGETPSINFFGGEPMFRYEQVIVPLTLYIRNTYGDNFNLSMTSNGMLFTEERLSFMREHGIALLFSMDGGREVQDVNRPRADGGSSFETLEKTVPLILQYYPEVMFRATVTEETQDKLFDSIMFAERQGFKTFFVMPDCFAVWKTTCGLDREMRRYSEHYINCLRGGVTPIYFSQLEKYFPRIRQYNRAVANNTMRDFDGCKACGKCGLGSNKFAGINISSMYGLRASVTGAIVPYWASKGAIPQLTRGWAWEFAPYNISVNAIAPGFFLSELMPGQAEDYTEMTAGLVPLKRIGHPSEMNGLITLLASDGASYLTGQTIAIDGGKTAI